MKISLRYLGGVRSTSGDWSLSPSTNAMEAYYKDHKSAFKKDAVITVQGITMKVVSITEKQKPNIVFSM